MMFVRLSLCLSGMGVHCDHTVRFSGDLSLGDKLNANHDK